jgi:hypothetical protein
LELRVALVVDALIDLIQRLSGAEPTTGSSQRHEAGGTATREHRSGHRSSNTGNHAHGLQGGGAERRVPEIFRAKGRRQALLSSWAQALGGVLAKVSDLIFKIRGCSRELIGACRITKVTYTGWNGPY